jgi:hypothetical protein
MKRRRVLLAAVVVVAALSFVTACGSSDDNHPAPTVGDPAVLERPGATTATTDAP